MMRASPSLFFAFALVAGCGKDLGPPSEEAISADTWAALERAERYEVLSLDPDRADPSEGLHGYRVLNRVVIDDPATQQRITAALRSGLHVADSNIILACAFQPRHAVHIVHDERTYDVLLCFQCHQAAVLAPSGRVKANLRVSDDVRPVLDQLLEQARASR